MPTNFMDIALDPITGDLDLSKNEIKLITSNVLSLRQRLVFRFSIWQGEWYFDESFGFPYRNYISKKVLKKILDNKIRETVKLEPDVVSINNFKSFIKNSTRSYEAYFEVTTREGESLNLAFLGRDPYSYPNPDDNTTSLCDKDGNITFANRLHYLINFRLPTWGDLTWLNKWSGEPVNYYVLTMDLGSNIYLPQEAINIKLLLTKDAVPVSDTNILLEILDQTFAVTTNSNGLVDVDILPSQLGKNEWVIGEMNISATYVKEEGSPIKIIKSVIIDNFELLLRVNGSQENIIVKYGDIINISGKLSRTYVTEDLFNYKVYFYNNIDENNPIKLNIETTTDLGGNYSLSYTIDQNSDIALQAEIER